MTSAAIVKHHCICTQAIVASREKCFVVDQPAGEQPESKDMHRREKEASTGQRCSTGRNRSPGERKLPAFAVKWAKQGQSNRVLQGLDEAFQGLGMPFLGPVAGVATIEPRCL